MNAGSERLSENVTWPPFARTPRRCASSPVGERLRADDVRGTARHRASRVAGSSRRSNVARTSSVVSRRPSAKRRPASNWTRNVRLPREMIGRSRARPGTMTVPGQALGIRVAHERRAERVHDRARLARRREGGVERRQRLCRHHAQASGRRARGVRTPPGAVVALSYRPPRLAPHPPARTPRAARGSATRDARTGRRRCIRMLVGGDTTAA